jgi:HEPN domain-containing protein
MTKRERLKKHVLYWITTAEYDWGTAQSLWRARRYDGCLFFCHLVCEKTLKAAVVKAVQEDAPRTHDLIRLCSDAGISLSDEQEKILAEINHFNIATRYPVDLAAFHQLASKDHSEIYYKFTGRFLKWVTENHL